MFQYNDIITNGKDTRRVLGVCDEVVLLSYNDIHNKWYSNYTQSELISLGYKLVSKHWEPKVGEVLKGIDLQCSWDGNEYCVLFGDNLQEGHAEFAHTEADARAKMRIYLIENKLI